VTVLDSEESTDQEGAAVASVGGLLVELTVPVEDLPTIPGPVGELDPNGVYVASVLLGATAARGAAFTFDPDAVPEPGADVGSFDPGTGFDGGAGIDLPPPDVAAPSAPPAVSPDPAPAGPQLARSVVDLFGDRLGLVYLALMFAVLGLCIAPRLFTPARLPGPHS
jgi:hypothetical protein